MKLCFGILIFAIGQVFGWYQLNLQKCSEWWEGRPIAAAVFLGIPTSIAFWYAWKMVSEVTDSVWSARFIGSCTGFMVFPILTWFVLGESMFTTKTIACLFLSALIILIQIFY